MAEILSDEHAMLRPGLSRLKGKVAIVTGANSGIGRATARLFAREGAKVFCADINLKAAEETAGIIKGEGFDAQAIAADVTKNADVEKMVTACVKAYGRIDVLDNNVGIVEAGGVVELPEVVADALRRHRSDSEKSLGPWNRPRTALRCAVRA